MKHVIYALIDPRNTNVVRYIGFTKKTLERRLIEHLSDARRGHMNHRCNWIRSLTKDNIRPIISIIEEVTEDNWQEREKYWIRFYKETLTNTTEGGEGLINPSDEVRERISKKVSENLKGNQYRKGIPHTEESKAAIKKGMKNSIKVKQFADARKGINNHANMTDEQKAAKGEKIRQSKLGKKRSPFSDEAKKNMSSAHIGIKHTEESKEKIRLANAGNKNGKGAIRTKEFIDNLKKDRLGSKFITNGVQCKRIKANEPIPEGWVYGMKLKEK